MRCASQSTAKNRARELGASTVDGESVIANPVEIDTGEAGKIRYVGYVQGERVRVVVGSCHVAFTGDRPVNVELLSPRDHLDSLAVAAERYALDGVALLAAAQAALAAPDQPVTLEIGVRPVA
jgi:hypothetical protein